MFYMYNVSEEYWLKKFSQEKYTNSNNICDKDIFTLKD